MKYKLLFAVGIVVLMLPRISPAAELRTRLLHVSYQEKDLLLQLNNRIQLGVSNTLGKLRKRLSVEEELSNKLDLIYGRVQEILDMHLSGSDLTINLLPNRQAVERIFHAQYKRSIAAKAFFSPEKNSIYLAVEEVNTGILVHVMTHGVVHHFFDRRPPERMYKLLAQYVKRQFKVSAKRKRRELL